MNYPFKRKWAIKNITNEINEINEIDQKIYSSMFNVLCSKLKIINHENR
ncbi:MAG TPA: hypothetical protein PKZ54_06035 [Syntrophorhabdaceae bacterium]|nr:hypothetical protein [Syntrophorhabdaceae bacterium]